jgi:UDP-glucose 4-epimerase
MAKKILITGGAGFIGSTIADTFVAAGWEVAVVDDLSSGKRENVPAAARFYPCDVRSAAAAEAIERERPDVLCHHAAQIEVRAGSVRQVLFASSGGATYGDTPVIPTPESHPQRPLSHYGASKAASELYLGVFQASYGLASAALRYANVYGPRQDPHGEAGVVAIFCGRLLDGKSCTIYGDGRQTRDYVFVGDVARANLLAAERAFAGPLNIGTGVETDVLQLHAGLSRAAGSTAAPIHAEARLGEQRRSCIDPSAAARALGWRPQVTVEQGLARTLQFFKAKRG